LVPVELVALENRRTEMATQETQAGTQPLETSFPLKVVTVVLVEQTQAAQERRR
jgi:hypothetical protein